MLGDRFGSSAARWIVEALETALLRARLSVRRNKPYAGGYITEHYGAPAAARHAVQIEINRALYMDERAIVKAGSRGALAEALIAAAEALAARSLARTGRPERLGGGIDGGDGARRHSARAA